MPLKKVGWPRG